MRVQSPSIDTTLVVIAGGSGSRMGGPKHSLQIAGEPILTDLLRRLRWSGQKLLALGAQEPSNVPGAEAFDEIVHDARPDMGPLAGVVRALEASTTPAIVVVPVDMPELSHDHLAWLIERVVERAGCAGMMCRRFASETRLEPFPLYLDRALLPEVSRMLESGERALWAITRLPGYVQLAVPAEWPEAVWTNLNTPDDLARTERARGYTGGSPSSRP